MAEIGPKRPWRRRLKLWLPLAVTLLVLWRIVIPRVTVGWRWSSVDARTRELLEKAKARRGRRPVLHGKPVPGNGWDDYTVAVESLLALEGRDELELFLSPLQYRKPRGGEVRSTLARHSGALELLEKGARREAGKYPIREDEIRSSLPKIPIQSKNLVLLALCKARFLTEEGRWREAAALLHSTCQFAGDLGRDMGNIHYMMSMSLYATLLDEVDAILRKPRVDPAFLEQIERILEGAKAALPRADRAAEASRLFTGLQCKEEGQRGAPFVQGVDLRSPSFWESGWRWGFSERVMLVETMEEFDAFVEDVRGIDELKWKDAEALLAKWEQAAADSGNPFSVMFFSGFRTMLDTRWDVLAKVCLRQAAVHWLRTGEVPTLDDPFGEALLHAPAGTGVRIWSVGRNGIDDKGVYDITHGDMVVEVGNASPGGDRNR